MDPLPLPSAMRVLRIYHGGRDYAHRGRDRALAALGVDLTLVVPHEWPDDAEPRLSPEPFRVVELSVSRAGDVNRHAYRDAHAQRELLDEVRPDVLDIHEEPVSLAARRWLAAAPADLPVVMYTAQNLDKRYPPPFARFERDAYRRVAAFYPCSRQAASVLRGKGFRGSIEVLPLGYDETAFHGGTQARADDEVVLALAGRLVPEKGVADAVRVLAHVNASRPARLILSGRGPEEARARALATSLGVASRLELRPWQRAADLANLYRTAHVVLVPSRTTRTWVEQFGRVIVEAQACGAVVAGYASGAIPEVAGRAGVLVAADDVDALAEAVLALVSDADELARLRGVGVVEASERTWRTVASRQAELYRAVNTGGLCLVSLPSSPRSRRVAARAEFGPTASTAAGARPFALPLLRRGRPVGRALATLIDAATELKSHLRANRD
jgi:glycosyltransferase involved in cell wall biosynthesis